MPTVVSVACLGPTVSEVVDAAVAVLNRCQELFEFQTVSDALVLPPPDLRFSYRVAPEHPSHADSVIKEGYSWNLLTTLLVQKSRDLNAGYLLGVLDRPIENNWFSRADHRQKIGFVTVEGWEYLSALPVEAFLAYELVGLFAWILVGKMIPHDETLGCLNDMCALKTDISFKIRTADICSDCREHLLRHMSVEEFDALVAMLEEVRLVALRRQGRVTAAKASSTAEAVDQRYPFPLAYCFRSMQAELSYARKWAKLLELYEVTVKYLTFVMLASLRELSPATIAAASPSLEGLKRPPGTGFWHQACFALLKALRQQGSFIDRYLTALGGKAVQKAHAASEEFLPLRNDTRGHGFVEEEAQYQARYEQHVGKMQLLLEFVGPLADYALIKVGDGLRKRQGVSSFPAKLLVGSHPLFPVQQYETAENVDTDCLLHDPQTGKYLSLYPWLLLEHCPACFREMVFLFDRCDDKGIVLREYPTNHTCTRSVIWPAEFRAILR
jgi:hypothetical protein